MRRRKQNRLKEYDYSSAGFYFVTICAQDREEWFGQVNDGIMILNEYGRIADECWRDVPGHYDCFKLDKYIIMPNHVHGIIIVNNDIVGEGFKPSPTHEFKRYGLTEFVRAFKTFSSRQINAMSKERFRWQRSFHDHIIRGEFDLNRICEYVINNPAQWAQDEYFGSKNETIH